MNDYGSDKQYSSLRVLVIEDEEYIRRIIAQLLYQIGFKRVDEAGDGTEGLDQVVRVRPDLILCDIHMKPMGGMTFLRTLRDLEQPGLSDIPVILLTSDTTKRVVSEAKNLKVNGYLAKPVSFAALKKRVDHVFI